MLLNYEKVCLKPENKINVQLIFFIINFSTIAIYIYNCSVIILLLKGVSERSELTPFTPACNTGLTKN